MIKMISLKERAIIELKLKMTTLTQMSNNFNNMKVKLKINLREELLILLLLKEDIVKCMRETSKE
jgi:hypothetical protein